MVILSIFYYEQVLISFIFVRRLKIMQTNGWMGPASYHLECTGKPVAAFCVAHFSFIATHRLICNVSGLHRTFFVHAVLSRDGFAGKT